MNSVPIGIMSCRQETYNSSERLDTDWWNSNKLHQYVTAEQKEEGKTYANISFLLHVDHGGMV